MKPETAYRYQKRIKRLEGELREARSELRAYREFSRQVFEVACECIDENKVISLSWMMKRSKSLLWRWSA